MTTRPAAVGGFVLGAIALGILAILFFGGTEWFAKPTEAVVFFDESVAGLEAGAPVTFRGARVGSVKSVAILVAPEKVTARIAVVLEINPKQVVRENRELAGEEPDYNRLVQAGLRAQLAVQSLITGQLRVDLDFRPGTPARVVEPTTGLPEIPAVRSELGQLRNELTNLPLRELVDAGQGALAAVDRLSRHIDAELNPLVSSTRGALDAATQTLQTANSAIDRVQADASTALRDLDLLLIDARNQLGSRGGELSRTLVSADRAARQVESLAGSLNGLVDSHSAVRGNLDATIRDLAGAASALRAFAQTIERNPNALLMGRSNR
jgi:paraquat-inducible protein B